MKKLRVALISPFPIRMYFSSNVEFITSSSLEHPTSWVINLINQLCNIPEIELHVISLGAHLKESYRFIHNNVHYHFLRGSRNTIQILSFFILDVVKIIKELRKISPDVVEAFGTEGPYGLAGVLSSFPCIVYIQGIVQKIKSVNSLSLSLINKLAYEIIAITERITITNGKHFIVENAFTGDFVKKQNSRCIIEEIPNLINPKFFDVTVVDHRNPSFLFIGSLSERKGVMTLLDAFMLVNDHIPDSELNLVGYSSDNDNKKIRSKINEHNNLRKVNLHGLLSHDQICKLMCQGHVVIHPSKMDSSPNSVYEAMAAGLPVIATNVGGIPFIINDKDNGLLVPENIEQIAEKMMLIINDADERKRLGINARNFANSRVNPKIIVKRTIDFYYRVSK